MMFNPKTISGSVAEIGEKGLIKCIETWLRDATRPSPEGIGDDCAVICFNGDTKQILTTDSVTYNQHFDDSIRAEDAGSKLIKRNLSDIASMGGAPGPALLNLLIGPNLSLSWLEAFIGGVRDECLQYDIAIVGGDISALPEGQFSAILTQTGVLVNTEPLLRSTANIGDAIYVTGSLGGSRIRKHYAFTPRLLEGQWLGASAACSSLMDLTDGLAKDLSSLLPPDSAAALDLPAIPIADDAYQLAKLSKKSVLEHAFCDGEDYELLFTVEQSTSFKDFEHQWRSKFSDIRLSRIGTLVESTGTNSCYIDAHSKEALPWTQGFEHLKQ